MWMEVVVHRVKRHRARVFVLAAVASVTVLIPFGMARPMRTQPRAGPPMWTLDARSITPIPTARNKAGTPISVGSEAGSVAITPNGSTAYVVTDDGVVPIDLATDTVEESIPVEGLAIAIAPNGSTAYVTTEDGSYRSTFPPTALKR